MKKPSKEELYTLYVIENKSLKDLSILYRVKRQTIQYWLHKYRIIKQNKIKKPCRKDLYYSYVQLNKSIKELTEQYKVCKNTIEGWLTSYQIKKGKEKAYFCLKRTLEKKYGVSNSFNIKGVENKIIQTNLKKYGCKKYSQTAEYKTKAKNTNLIKYNCEFPNQNKEIKEKVKNTCLKRYNSTNYLTSNSYKDKLYNKYKVFNINQIQIPKEVLCTLQDKSRLLNIITLLHSKTYKALGSSLKISESTAARYVKYHGLDYLMNFCSSSLEQEIKNLFSTLNLKKDRKILSGQEIDLYSEEHKIGIEFNGNYWHTDKFRSKNYHFNKSKLAKSKGVFLYHIFEYEWLDKRTKNIIIDQLKDLFNYDKEVIKVEDCTIKEVPTKDKNAFLNNNHLLNKCKSTVNLGLYYKDKLVGIMVFIRVKDQDSLYELSRFCCKIGYRVINGFNYLFDYFIKQYKPKSIIVYSDIAKEDEKILGSIGFKLKSIEKPQYCWTDGDNILTQGQDSLKYIKKKGWLKKDDKSVDKVMKDHKFNRLYDCGRKKWLWSI